MYLPRPANLLSSLVALLETGTQHTPQDTTELKQLRKSIMEHGQMVYDLNSCQPVRIEVKELAYRLRESPTDVTAALALLEREGRAFRTRYKGLWKLRITPENEATEIHEDYSGNTRGESHRYLTPVPARRLYQSPRLIQLSASQAKAIVAERALAGDAEFERAFQSPRKSDPVG
jgi:hypothetical protein